ncbi:MAG: hypothetical protein IT436_03690 [Phycisphaerales bacterium]|nr:hypothetical protein [Phycisphaerales bacterium]
MNGEGQPVTGPAPSDEGAEPTPLGVPPPAAALAGEAAAAPAPDDGLAHEELTEPEPINYDRWAHRRAEPRPLAFMWTLYLFTATAMTFAAITGVGGLTLDVYRPALRILLMTVAAGVIVVWPMIRLSQTGPAEHPAAAALKDLFAIVVPLQAIVWPQWLLASWPVSVIAGLTGTLTAWAVLASGILALYFRLEAARGGYGAHDEDVRGGGFGARASMMLLFVMLAGLGPVIGAAWSLLTSLGPGAPGRATWWLLSSPLTAIVEITADRPEGAAAVRGVAAHWAVAANVAVAGLVCWFWSVTPRRPGPGRVTSGPTSA